MKKLLLTLALFISAAASISCSTLQANTTVIADDAIIQVAHTSTSAVYSTTFNTKDTARRVNITQAAKSINGTVVHPGQEFSFNQTVGPTIKRRGYMAGRIFVNGKDSMGYGGGVCQVSSTLFCAVQTMGLKTTERHAHSKPVYYVPKGYDAATSYGVIDYKFVNNKSFPIIIETAVNGDKLIVSIRAY